MVDNGEVPHYFYSDPFAEAKCNGVKSDFHHLESSGSQ